MRRFMASGLLASLGSILLACSSTQVSPAKAKMVPSAPTTSAEEEERAALESALTKVQNKQYAEAITALQSVIDIPAFTELGQSQQHLAIYAAGIVALNLNDYPRAAKFLKRSSSFEQAGLNDWIGRLRAAYVLKDVSDSALCLATIAKRWPQTLGTYDDRYVFSLVRQTTSLGDQEPRFQLINALYQAYWKPKSGIEPSSLWMELSLLLLERHDADRAASVAAHVSDPYSLISLHADKRFDDIVMADPGQFDVISAVDLEIQRLQSAIEKAPKLLTLRVQLTYALLTARRYKEVLNVTDQIIAQVANGDGSQSYEDLDTSLTWIMDNRARALKRLGRWDEALEQLKQASEKPVYGDTNVSQSINLAFLYAELGHPKKALGAIENVNKNVSAYGQMQIEAVRHIVAVEMNNAVEASRSLAYLRDHKSDAVGTFQENLIVASEYDEAAALLISRLENPKERVAALLELQNYAGPPEPPLAAEWRNKYLGLLARRDVKDALDRVGRIASYDLDQGPT